jgi:hypothetical protein
MAACALLFAGCAGGGRAVVPGGTYPRPEAALHALAASIPGGTVTATARIEIANHGERYPLKAAVMMRRPADLRVESIPLFGLPDFFLTISGGELRVFLPGKGEFYAGPATGATISRFFPLALPPDEIVSLLMGRPPGEEEISGDLRGEQEDGLYRVDQYRDGRRARSLWIDPAGGILIRARIFTGGEEILYTADFADYTQAGKGFMPQRLTISGEAMSLTLRYTEIRVLDDAVSFALPIPEGITPIPLQGGR